jgi:hypothetical protein
MCDKLIVFSTINWRGDGMEDLISKLSREEKKRIAEIILKHVEVNNNGTIGFKSAVRDYADIMGFMFKDFEHETKKAFKILYKKALRYDEDDRLFLKDIPQVINQGVRVIDKDMGTSWYYWYLFGAENEKEVVDIIEKFGEGYIYIEGDKKYSPYDCTGEIYSDDMWIRKVGRNRVLATKLYRLDV